VWRPGTAPDLLGWSDDLLRGLGTEDPALVEAMLRAFDAYSTYVRPVIQDRRRTGDESDLIGLLTHAEVDGDRLDDDSILYEALLILIGGDETTRHVLTGGMEQLLAHPDQSALLRRDPALLPVAVEEMLRWVTPIKNMARTVTADTEFAGKHLEEGQQLLLLYPSANRDEAVFAEPSASTPPPTQRPSGLRLRRALLPRQPAGPPRAAGDVRAALGPAPRHGPGR